MVGEYQSISRLRDLEGPLPCRQRYAHHGCWILLFQNYCCTWVQWEFSGISQLCLTLSWLDSWQVWCHNCCCGRDCWLHRYCSTHVVVWCWSFQDDWVHLLPYSALWLNVQMLDHSPDQEKWTDVSCGDLCAWFQHDFLVAALYVSLDSTFKSWNFIIEVWAIEQFNLLSVLFTLPSDCFKCWKH